MPLLTVQMNDHSYLFNVFISKLQQGSKSFICASIIYLSNSLQIDGKSFSNRIGRKKFPMLKFFNQKTRKCGQWKFDEKLIGLLITINICGNVG